MNYKQTETDIYPTRYHALSNPGFWAIFAPIQGMFRRCREDATPESVENLGACRDYAGEAAILYVPASVPGEAWRGVSVEIGGPYNTAVPAYRGRYCADCHISTDAGQKRQRLWRPCLVAAIEVAEAWLKANK
jgi:hypothetical protein